MKKRRGFLFLVGVLLAVTGWCHGVLQVSRWEVEVDGLPEVFAGTRILLLTDLHGRTFGKQNARLLRAAEQCAPDLIAIVGDLADANTELASLEPLIRGLCRMAPVYYVTGNHEWDGVDTQRLLEQLSQWGAVVLQNEAVVLTRGEQQLLLVGAEDPNGPADMERPTELITRIRQEYGMQAPLVVLYHRNDALAQWADLGVDVVLSGHGHGGVIRLPLIGGLLGTDRTPLPKYTEGLYRLGDTTMAVSRGLGGVRLWNRPHLPLLILQKR